MFLWSVGYLSRGIVRLSYGKHSCLPLSVTSLESVTPMQTEDVFCIFRNRHIVAATKYKRFRPYPPLHNLFVAGRKSMTQLSNSFPHFGNVTSYGNKTKQTY